MKEKDAIMYRINKALNKEEINTVVKAISLLGNVLINDLKETQFSTIKEAVYSVFENSKIKKELKLELISRLYNDNDLLLYRIDARLKIRLQNKIKKGEKLISNKDVDSLIDAIIKEELTNQN
jgi:ribosomal protein S13